MGINVILFALSLPIGIYFAVTECPTDDKYSRMCLIGVLLIWIGALNLVLLVLSTIFVKFISVKKNDLERKEELLETQISGAMGKKAKK
ncbi:unnamed protein product [Hymenolepis diminuta]|uniref:G_PROTEIN_RECEP_F1_2 domain-containing protein n=1 Tax=Hymenolepis diminuta TaxID=6216 RepID=A0A564XXJ4_HYMDI|nr:unnamed protein product [Hymenolepis diminuta]